MSTRRLLLIDSDDNFFRILHEQVSPYGFEIYRVEESSEALNHVRDVLPQLIFIAVEEPDKVGYSLCNKAKKGVAQNIPVVLTTSSVPPSGFHSHRKLKVHADEYIDKRTMSPEELVGKIDNLVGLNSMPIEEMSFEEVEEFELSEEGFDDGAKTRIASPHVLLDLDDPETDAAVDSLMSGLSEDNGFDDDMATSAAMPRDYLNMMTADPGEATVIVSSRGRSEPARAAPVQPTPAHGREDRTGRSSGAIPAQSAPSRSSGAIPVQSAPGRSGAIPAQSAPSRKSGAIPAQSAPSRKSGAIPAQSAPSRSSGAIPVQSAPSRSSGAIPVQSAPSRSSGAIPAQSAPSRSSGAIPAQSAPSGRSGPASVGRGDPSQRAEAAEEQRGAPDPRLLERLRTLERDNERLKADLDAARQAPADTGGDASSFSREREFLSLRETINKKERELLDLRDEVGSKERQILEGKEQLSQLQHSKAALDSRNLELEQRVLEISEQLEAERAGAEHNLQALQARIQELEAEVEQASENNAQAAVEIETLNRQLAELAQRHAQELESTRRQLGQEHEARLSALSAEHAQAMERLKNEHGAGLRQARESHAQELQARDQQHQKTIQELGAKHAQELDGLRGAHAAEMAGKQREHEGALAGADSRHKDEVARVLSEAERSHTAALAEIEKERAELDAGLRSARQSITGLERYLEQTRGMVVEREKTIDQHEGEIGSLKAEIAELESQNADYQEQVLKAFQKIKTDEATVAKAKKALAIALTLLDENIAGGDEAAAPGGGSGERLS
jgi:CheY-like chemotaxis protein